MKERLRRRCIGERTRSATGHWIKREGRTFPQILQLRRSAPSCVSPAHPLIRSSAHSCLTPSSTTSPFSQISESPTSLNEREEAMESPNPDAGLKRKRSPADEVPARHGHGPANATAGVTTINYFVKARGDRDRLRLIEGDAETFRDVLGAIDDYEGILHRHESLAASLGAKLVGPLLLKSFEKLFDGPIRVTQSSFVMEQSPVTWLDIVTFARSNPGDFALSDFGNGLPKACRFWIKGGQVEISEDDYRLIMSGAPERMIPSQPLVEDEQAELGTINILEARLALLIKKADVVASKARQLNYHLKGHKTVVLSRQTADQSSTISPEASLQAFCAVNSRSSAPSGDAVKLQQDLLEQFLPSSRLPSLVSQPRPKAARVATSDGPTFHNSQQDADIRQMSHPITSSDDGIEGQHRAVMAGKIEKLAKGEAILPPCDRCRRLKFDCTKHLTACGACTKKHAKCSWKDVREGELGEATSPVSASGYMPRNEDSYPASATSAGASESLDPGLRPHQRPDTGFQNGEKPPESAAEHLVLTQIAVAAADHR